MLEPLLENLEILKLLKNQISGLVSAVEYD